MSAAEAPDIREQEDCPGGEFCDWACDQHERPVTGMDERLAKVAEVLGEHYYARPYVCACGNTRWSKGGMDAHQAQALAPLLAEWQAEDEVALGRVRALAGEWEAAAETPMPKRAPTESAQDQGVRVGVWHSVRVAARELRAALDGAQS